MNEHIYPLLFKPVYKDYIWGGSRIASVYGRDVDMEVCAESWEIADRPEGMSVVENGPLSGRTLRDLAATLGTDLLGATVDGAAFPLLIKIIDAKQRLSVQVHPNDETAALHGGEPKTEMWYVLDAEPGASIFAGLKKGTDAASFRAALDEERLEDVLCSIPARPGEAIYIPGGRVHAIGEGCLLLEVQQNSNTTYRVYDWGRMGTDGKPRELHVDQAFRVIDWNSDPVTPTQPRDLDRDGNNTWRQVISCPYFSVLRIDLTEQESISPCGKSFHALFASRGKTLIEGGGISEELAPGTSCLIPAALAGYTLTPQGADSRVLQITGTGA